MKMNLFAYGTLMWPEVLEAVTGRRFEGEPAVLDGYICLRVKGEHYPAVVADSSEAVTGVLYRGLTDKEFVSLDLFEGEMYERVELPVGGELAYVYRLSGTWMHKADALRWKPEQLTRDRLSAFCTEYKGWSDLESENPS